MSMTQALVRCILRDRQLPILRGKNAKSSSGDTACRPTLHIIG
jgi:hypothetical protein